MKFLKTNKDVTSPQRAYETDAGIDFFIPLDLVLRAGESACVASGIKVIIPTGYCGIFFNKSSIGKKGLLVGAQVVDSSYRGEVHIDIHNVSNESVEIHKNEKIVQMIVLPIYLEKIEQIQQSEFDNYKTERADKGFGSTGRFV